MRLIYGFDPLCGWCYGFVPAVRAVRAAFPDLAVRLVLPGLVTGTRVGPYAAMEGYIRGASVRLKAVTGRAPAPAFFDLIRRPGVIGDSAPPVAVLAAARDRDPARALDLAAAMIEAHFRDGADLGDPATYPPLLTAVGLDGMAVPGPDAAAAVMAADRAEGIASFPTLILDTPTGRRVMPSLYDPSEVTAWVARELTA
jgi:putative protein-disulfide isomerase